MKLEPLRSAGNGPLSMEGIRASVDAGPRSAMRDRGRILMVLSKSDCRDREQREESVRSDAVSTTVMKMSADHPWLPGVAQKPCMTARERNRVFKKSCG